MTEDEFYNILRHKLKSGGALTTEEISRLKKAIVGPEPTTDVALLLRCLGRFMPPNGSNMFLAESILRIKSNDWWVQGSLHALCKEWGIVEPYLKDLFTLTAVKEWMLFSDSAITAFSILGEFVHAKRDPRVYSHLLGIIREDYRLLAAGSPDFWPVHLEAAIGALDQGIRGAEALIDPYHMTSSTEVPEALLEEAEKRARTH